MAFVGHPVLADIRKGIRLRPTHTVDKSRPVIRAEGEGMPSLQPRGPPSAPPPPPAPAAPNGLPPPPPAIGRSPAANGMASRRADALEQQMTTEPAEGRRQKMLAQIRGGVRLRPVQTADKSGLILDEQQREQAALAHLPPPRHSPSGSLGSQGKSPSPSSLAPSSPHGSSAVSALSAPSPASVGHWPSDCSDQSLASPAPSPPPPLSAGQPNLLCPQNGGRVQRRQQQEDTKKSDFQFDDEKQIQERRSEVAVLAGRGGAQAKIAAFRQLQQSSTLPRARAQQNETSRGSTTGGRGKEREQPQQNGPRQKAAAAPVAARPNGATAPQQKMVVKIPGSTIKIPPAQQPQQTLQRSASSSAPLPPPAVSPPVSPAQPSPTGPTPAGYYRPFAARVGQGAHKEHFDSVRGRFAGQNGGGGDATQSAEAVWKSAARQRKEANGLGSRQTSTGSREQQQKSAISPTPPPLPPGSPPPLDDGRQQQDWTALRERYKFAVDLDGGPNGNALIRIVRR